MFPTSCCIVTQPTAEVTPLPGDWQVPRQARHTRSSGPHTTGSKNPEPRPPPSPDRPVPPGQGGAGHPSQSRPAGGDSTTATCVTPAGYLQPRLPYRGRIHGTPDPYRRPSSQPGHGSTGTTTHPAQVHLIMAVSTPGSSPKAQMPDGPILVRTLGCRITNKWPSSGHWSRIALGLLSARDTGPSCSCIEQPPQYPSTVPVPVHLSIGMSWASAVAQQVKASPVAPAAQFPASQWVTQRRPCGHLGNEPAEDVCVILPFR